MSVLRSTQVQTSQIVFSELKKAGPSKTSYINYQNATTGKQQRLIVQFPKMFAPFGASYYNPDNTPISEKMPKFNVQLSLDEKVKGVTDFVKLLNSLDKIVKKKALKNKDWKKQLPKGLDEAGLKYCYKSVVKASGNEKYSDSVNTKVPIDWNNKQPLLQLYGKNKDKLDVTFETIENLLPKLSELKGLIQISNVWFVNKKFGITIKLLQGMVYPKESLSGFSLLDDSDDEGSDEEEESDDEEEEEVEVETDDEDDE